MTSPKQRRKRALIRALREAKKAVVETKEAAEKVVKKVEKVAEKAVEEVAEIVEEVVKDEPEKPAKEESVKKESAFKRMTKRARKGSDEASDTKED